MKNKLLSILGWTKRDAMRVLPLAALALLLLYGDDAWRVVAYSIGVVITLVLVSHIVRRIAFNRLDIQSIASRATDNPIGAAIVFAAVVWFLGTVIQSGVGLLR